MKKTLSINIAGFLFHIEEDAYQVLESYLNSIHAYFDTFEGSKEIIADIEARIAEKFLGIKETEKTEAISIDHVQALILSLGTVADFKEMESDEIKNDSNQTSSPTDLPKKEKSKVFRRDISKKMIGGVASGIANYFGIDPIWARLIILVGFFGAIPLLHAGNFVFWAYIILWIAIPGELNVEEDKSIRKFFRDPERKVIGGVMSGIAAYTGWDLGALRIIAVLSAAFFGTGILAYLVIMAISPTANTITDKMQMTGEPITLENIEANIKKSIAVDPEDEGVFTRIVLFPFRIVSTVFRALKGPLQVVRWAIQIFAGIILAIISMALLGSIIAIYVLGFTGIDQGQLVHMGTIPLYLLAKDLPFWAFPAIIAAILPIIISIGIAGISLLANKNLYHKTYRIIATSVCIVGWIAIFAAIPFVGRNFQRSASINSLQEIALTDSVLVFEINKQSSETIFEKLLGNDFVKEEILSNEELHDYNLENFNRADISIEGHSGKTIQVIQFVKSKGLTRSEAELNARSVLYQYGVKGNAIKFDTHFGIKNQKFRNQQIRVKILIPFGKQFGISRDFASYIQNEIPNGFFNEDDGDKFIGSLWVFTNENGLTCVNRTPKMMEDSEVKSEFEKGIRDGFKEGDSNVDDQVNFSFSKTLSPFHSIEMPVAESASIKILKGPISKITYQSPVEITEFSSKATIENGILKFPSVQSGLIIVIETPTIDKLMLGGSAKTEISGFDVPTLEVVLSDFHSLTLSGKSQNLIASASQNSELLAGNWQTQKAIIALESPAKMDLNVVSSIKGRKGDRADLSYKPSAKLKVDLNNNSKK